MQIRNIAETVSR